MATNSESKPAQTPAQIKAALQQRIAQLKEQRENPVTQSPLYPYREELRMMKRTLGLSNKAVVRELSALGVDASENDVRKFYHGISTKRPAKTAKRLAPKATTPTTATP